MLELDLSEHIDYIALEGYGEIVWGRAATLSQQRLLRASRPPLPYEGMVESRYLTPEAKVIELAHFERIKKQPRPEGNLGGRGFIDPEIVPFCDWLNSHDSFCTLQSCTGHFSRPDNTQSMGILWIWMDESMSELFRLRVPEINGHYAIGRVSQVYSRWGEFAEIIFAGLESDRLQESLTALQSFFVKLIHDQTTRTRT